MPALAPPVADERSALREFLAYHQSAYFAVSYGLTDDQARSSPTVSALSIGGLVKHVTGYATHLDGARRRRSGSTAERPSPIRRDR